MATGKEIRGKIKNFESTKKITKAMEMISVSKMRKAQERMRAARPYAEKVRNIAAHLGEAGHARFDAVSRPVAFVHFPVEAVRRLRRHFRTATRSVPQFRHQPGPGQGRARRGQEPARR